MKQIVELSLFGASYDQGTFQSTVWGLLTFFPTKSEKWCDNCRHCLLWKRKDDQTRNDECLTAPCSDYERRDGQNGYFSICEMP